MVTELELEDYFRSLPHHCAQWPKSYAFIDEINEREFELNSKTQDKPIQPDGKPKEKLQPALEATDEYALNGLNELKNVEPQLRIDISSLALTDKYVAVRNLAAKTLQKIGSTNAIDALVKALKHHEFIL
jgi:hypothetical protein